MGSNFCLLETDRSFQLKPFPGGLMLSPFTLPSSQFQNSIPSNSERDLGTPGGDSGCFSWGHTVCWGWVTSTYTNFPAVPPMSLHCPHPIKISSSDIFQPPKPPKTGVRHVHCCPSLGLLIVGNRQTPNPEQLSVQVTLPNWTTAAPTSERKLLRFKQQPWNKGNFPRVKQQ